MAGNDGTRDEKINVLPHISFQKILNQIMDGVIITDMDKRIVYWNKRAEELTGITMDEILNSKCSDIDAVHHTDINGCSLCKGNCPLTRAIAEKSSWIYPHLVFVNSKYKTDLPVSISVGPINNEEGEAVGGIIVFRDMRDEYRQRKLAGEIQKQMITLGKIKRNGLFIDTLYQPVEEIGGDFIEAFFLDDKTLVATIADATGHGLSASLFTVIYKTLLHSSFSGLHDPAEILNSVNAGFMNTTRIDGYYLTASMVNINPYTMRGKLSSAGHPPGLIFAATGEGYRLKEELRLRSTMIGVEENSDFREIDFSLKQGEFLLLTSDGIIESECKDDTLFSITGIENFFSIYQGNNHLKDLLSYVLSQSKYTELIDDVSLILITPVDS